MKTNENADSRGDRSTRSADPAAIDRFRDRGKVCALLFLSFSFSPRLRLSFGERVRRSFTFQLAETPRSRADAPREMIGSALREREGEEAILGSCGSRVPLHVRTKLGALAAASDRRRFAIPHRDHVMAEANPRFRIPFRRRSSVFLSPSGEPSPGTGWVDLYGLPVRAFLSGLRFEIRQPKSAAASRMLNSPEARARAEFIRAGKSARRRGNDPCGIFDSGLLYLAS